jgi:hypothetical protein
MWKTMWVHMINPKVYPITCNVVMHFFVCISQWWSSQGHSCNTWNVLKLCLMICSYPFPYDVHGI